MTVASVVRVLVLMLVLVAPRDAGAALQGAGNVVACTEGPGWTECTLDSGGRIRLDLYADDILRVRISPDGTFRERPTGALVPDARRPHAGQTFETDEAVFIRSPALTAGLFKAPLRLVVWRADGSLVSVDAEDGLSWDRETGVVVSRKMAFPGERYLGLGERGGPVDRRGRRIVMKNTDRAAFDSFTDPLYISIPFYYTFHEGAASGMFLDSGASPFFEFDVDRSGVVVTGVLAGELDYYLMAGPEPSAVSNAYHQLTGPVQLPPRWALGYHQSRYSYMSGDELLNVAWLLRALDIPADVLYLDIDYLDRLRMFTWNPTTFPDPRAVTDLLRDWRFRTVTIQEPLNHIGDPLWPYLSQSGFFLRGPDGTSLINDIWLGRVSWLDFSKSAVRSWYTGALSGFVGTYGIDGVWNDLNEPAQNYMPEAVYDFDGQPRSDLEARNLYALLEARASWDAFLAVHPDERPWIFSRSGSAGFHRYGANWGGDADTSFSSLRANVEMSVSMGLSGQAFFGHDIGGFLGTPSPELFLRWMTFSAYTPLFRNHAINYAARREPWAFGLPTLSMARTIINERYRLIPYFYSLFRSAITESAPVVAPLLYHFPADQAAHAISDQFMLGPSMLVAPIVDEGQVQRWLYLPAGANWIEERTDTLTGGGTWVAAAAGLAEIPVFVRDGSIIPRAPVAQSTADQPADYRSLDVYCGSAARFTLYDDDGTSFAFERGVYRETSLTCTPGVTTTIGIARTGGSWTTPSVRQWRVHLHRIETEPPAVRVDGTALPRVATEADLDAVAAAWTYTSDQRVVVRIADRESPIAIAVDR